MDAEKGVSIVGFDPAMTPAPPIHESTPGDTKENLWIKFLSFIGWYHKGMQSAEKLLVLKLDLSILIFGCLSFFTKYLDQQSITNAYVSGMKEEIGLYGNELNYLTATFWASYCTAMIPACYFITRYPANLVLPTLELGWGLATFGLSWAKNVNTLYALRFLVGLFECASFTGTIYIIGSWYKPHEIARRVAIFFVSSPLGTMFAGYLQAAAYTHLNGVNGLSGWRWLFIIDAIITLGISFLGYLVFPDVPSRKKPWFLSSEEQALAQKRLAGFTAPPELKLSRSIFKRVFGRWHFYVFVLQWTLMDLNFQTSSTPFSLYLKAYSPKLYSVVQVNTLPTIATAISVVAAITAGVAADKLRNFWMPIVATMVPVVIGMAMLVAWNIGEHARLAAFMLGGFIGPLSPMSMSWASVIMANDAEERAVVTASMNSIGQAITAGVQVVMYPATGAPRWVAGFKANLALSLLQVVVTFGIVFLSRRERRGRPRRAGIVPILTESNGTPAGQVSEEDLGQPR
ncbi:major facilitator superfamily domain-containing protein [Truncatella angustata]|uniref:Major facilitator superfamily domain-containing protein n=1 Tax=Truncatella angustata TaxID=152316 RepID=A0A9P8RFU2_9PEZI|nr:major facilitator superfamily domain-containing protein [Truncatella angustata]KAH6645059.1 major facilitator superfamily domain-containing protein [Truncatella angustata]